MDGPTAQYLQPIAGLDAAMWVPPSRGQLFWVRRAPALFAPALAYQSYLNHVFHRTRLARVGHAACMPVIVTALLALLYPVHAVLPGALALAAWWAYWAVKERDPVWGGCAVALAAALYPLAQALGRLGAAGPPFLAQPWALLLLAGLLQAGSHILEPLPPRVTRSVHWIPPAEYLIGRAGHRNRPGTVLRRAGQLTAQAVFGTVDEIVASPRLLPVLMPELLWLSGHDPVRRAAYRALSARAIANGNPALDYIGTGGPTPLRAPLRRQDRLLKDRRRVSRVPGWRRRREAASRRAPQRAFPVGYVRSLRLPDDNLLWAVTGGRGRGWSTIGGGSISSAASWG